MGAANDGLRFLLELGVLGAVAWWAFATRTGAARWVLGIGLPVAIAAIWAIFVNPEGSRATSDPVRLLLEVVVLGGGAAALAGIGRQRPAAVFAAVVALHLALTFPLGQR
jgi:hypothetical protein